jgi:hypothetical protein
MSSLPNFWINNQLLDIFSSILVVITPANKGLVNVTYKLTPKAQSNASSAFTHCLSIQLTEVPLNQLQLQLVKALYNQNEAYASVFESYKTSAEKAKKEAGFPDIWHGAYKEKSSCVFTPNWQEYSSLVIVFKPTPNPRAYYISVAVTSPEGTDIKCAFTTHKARSLRNINGMFNELFAPDTLDDTSSTTPKGHAGAVSLSGLFMKWIFP